MNTKKVEKSKFDQGQLLKNSSIFYLILASVGLMVVHYRHDSLFDIWQVSTPSFPWWQVLSIGLLTAGVVSIKSYLFEDFFPSYKGLKELMVSVMGRLSLAGAIYLAVFSAVAEEILFRGAIQPAAGVVFTSLLFALLHIGPANAIGAWSLMAFLSSLLFGWTFEATGSLWPSLIAHSLVNLISLLRFRVLYKKNKSADADREEARRKLRGAE